MGAEGEEEGGGGEKYNSFFVVIQNVCLDFSPQRIFVLMLMIIAHHHRLLKIYCSKSFMFIQVNSHNNLNKEVLQLFPFSFKVKKQRKGG